MAIQVTYDGVTYTLPSVGETGWGDQVTALLVALASGASISLDPVGSSPNANGASFSAGTLTLQPANGTHPGVLSNTAQTIAGTVAASNLSGTNTGDVSLAAVGASPNANGASLSGQQLTLQPASAAHPGVLSAADFSKLASYPSAPVAGVLFFGASAAAAAGVTAYLVPGHGTATANTTQYRLLLPFNCTLSHLYYTSGGTGAVGGTTTLTLRKTNADTSVTVTVAAGVATGSDTSNSVDFDAGDYASLRIVSNVGVATPAPFPQVSLKVTPR
jgi:hypothetical protein